MKKKLITLLMVLSAMALVGCGSKEPASQSTDDSVAESVSKEDQAEDEETELYTGGSVTEELVRNYPVTDENLFEVTEIENGVRVDSYIGEDPIVVIPEKIDGKQVLEVASYVFSNDSIVRGVLIPNTVKELEDVFGNNSILEVVICEGVEILGNFNFGKCISLHTVVLGDNLKMLKDNAFVKCKALRELYIAPSARIEEGYETTVFFLCEDLTIIGEKGSYIEGIAEQYGFEFREK